MSVIGWIAEFRTLHEKAQKKALSEADKKLYLDAREQLARALAGAQGLVLKPGEKAREHFRVAQLMQIELSLAREMVKCATQDVSLGGCSVTMAKPPEENEVVGFTLKLPGGVDPLVGRAQTVSIKRGAGNARVSLSFQGLSEADRERLEMVLFDLALARLR
ncbi:MAG: PilZ domain-containing protein [Myxococcota bacterium]